MLFVYPLILENTGMASRRWQKNRHALFNLYMISSLLNLLSCVFGSGIVYVENCEGHVLSDILPICEEVNGTWTHVKSNVVFFSFLFLQYAITFDWASSVFVNYGAIVFLIFGSQQISRELW